MRCVSAWIDRDRSCVEVVIILSVIRIRLVSVSQKPYEESIAYTYLITLLGSRAIVEKIPTWSIGLAFDARA